MENSSKSDMTPLEIEIENKIVFAYLMSISAKNHKSEFSNYFIAHFIDFTQENPQKLINNKNDKNENK